MAFEKRIYKSYVDGKLRKNAIDEISDIFIYLIAFCNENDIDIKQAIDQKMKKNKKKYPANIFKGRFNQSLK